MSTMTSVPAAARATAALFALAALCACTPADASEPVAARPSTSAPSTSAAPAPPSTPAAPAPASAPASPTPAPPAQTTKTTQAATGAAVRALAQLTVKGRAPMTGYSRDQFGPAWTDTDRNGCDQRNDVLRRDLREEILKAGTRGCVVLSGTFTEPYSGKRVLFQRGPNSGAVQIDHVVALADAWQSGAQQWDPAKRLRYANDPLVLLAADGPLNGQKGASNAASWLPPNKAYRCAYVAQQVAIKAAYGLWVTAPERDAIARVLASCPNQPLPTSATTAVPPRGAGAAGEAQQAAPAPTPAKAATPQAPAPAGADVYYQNCAAVRAAGKAPIRAGDPGYSRKLDRDGDGTACDV